MCGIGALLDPAGTVPAAAEGAMLAALRHRGPDGEAARRIGPAVLLHTRLAIIDVAGGDQPLASEDGAVTAVVNGEIYNHLDLRRELEAEGHRFATRSDSEVVVHGYEAWGLDVLGRLNGIFAFALWDDRARRLVVARDPFGVKPVYWWSDGRRVAAASEIGALLAGGFVRAEIDPVALDHVLAWRFVPAPRTLFKGVSKLAAASYLIAGEDGVHVAGYRRPPGEPLADAGVQELERELRAGLLAAVDRQMMSDVPYGAFLSGGVDSAAIVAGMRRAEDRAPDTFTIGFPGHDGGFDERDAAARSALLLRAQHRDTAMEQTDFTVELGRCVRRLEEPSGIPSAPALLQLSGFARERVKVVLSGQGADEPLGGYQRHQAAAVLRLAGHVPGPLAGAGRGWAAALPRNERAKRAAGLLGPDPAGDRLLRLFDITSADTRMALAGHAGAEAAAERSALADGVLADVPDRSVLEQALYLDTHLFLPDNLLVYGDKMSMAHGLEQRVPFLDVELMSLVERIPAHLRVHRLTRKWVYRRSLRGLVPAEVLERRKQPFATPYDRWLRTELGTAVERSFAPGSALGTLVAPGAVRRLVAEHRSGRSDHKRILYCLLELAGWHGAFIAGAAAPASAAALAS